MSESTEIITQNIKDLANGPTLADSKFRLQRIRTAGTPLLWEEIISIELGGNSSYSTLRSFVNAGDMPIGLWEKPAAEQTIQSIAETLVQLKFCDIDSTPVAPGGEENKWELSVKDGDFVIATGGDPDIMMKLSELDVQLRRIANELVSSKSGCALNIQLTILQKGETAEVQVALTNEGNTDFQIQNPCKSSQDDINFLRVEMGAAPGEIPGITGADIAYRPLTFPKSNTLPPPWDQDFIVLKVGQKIVYPSQLYIDLSAHRGDFVHAIYSHYGNTTTDPDLPLIRGRVFSEETQLV